jgi:hypothetical protein
VGATRRNFFFALSCWLAELLLAEDVDGGDTGGSDGNDSGSFHHFVKMDW